MLRYTAKARKLEDPSLGEYQTNAIIAMEGDMVLGEISDVSPNCELTDRIVGALNEGSVSVTHFHDVVVDLVAEAYSVSGAK